MSNSEVGEKKLFGFTHGLITEVHVNEGWLQYRQIEAHAVDDKNYGCDLDGCQTARDLFIDGVETFFPVDGAELSEVICSDIANIKPGRFLTCFDMSEVILGPDVDDPSYKVPYHMHFREVWLGRQAAAGDIHKYLEQKALSILEQPAE